MKGRLAATLFALATLALLGCGVEHDPEDKGKDRGYSAKVVSITDGDTVAVRIRRETENVRLIGIDTPEVYGSAECGGEEASSAMRRLLEPGDRVELLPDRSQPGRDHYGRLLRYVEHRGDDVGRDQLLAGHAEVLVVGEDPARLDRYERAQEAAEAAGRGIWGSCDGI